MKFSFSAVLLLCLLSACVGDNEMEVFDDNIIEIEEYLAANNLNADVSVSGLHYIISEPGSVNHPNAFNEIDVDYRGYLIDGTTFDSGTDVTFNMQNVIAGWQEGIPLIGKGGQIMLLVPARLAYGDEPPEGVGIPENVPLIFDVTLNDFN